jgi:hypothetical protein
MTHMPKVPEDQDLRSQIEEFVRHVGTNEAAATLLDINKSTLWKFRRGGCAIDRTRTILREGLARNKRNENDKESEINGAESNVIHKTLLPDQLEDLGKWRSMFQTMIVVIDLFEQTIRK